MLSPQFVTEAMIPREWIMSPSQEREWITHLAPEGVDPASLERMVTVELPDVGISWEYERAYLQAAKQRSGLLAPVITSQEQWLGREELAFEVIRRLLHGLAPAVVFVALAVPKK